MEWQPYELHTHTLHSDGQHTLMEMATEAKKIGIKGIALTDHNTMSGLVDQELVEDKTGIHIVHGLEWTTFYGHMLIIGIEEYVDWRILTPVDIEQSIKQVHKQGGLVGIAHPFCLGTPICTGCFWEYEISDWGLIDYIEVWSEPFPSIRKLNKRAFDLWTDKLNLGLKIAATSGRDWHKTNPNEGPLALTYLHMDANTTVQVIKALKQGNVSVTQGPLLLLSGKVCLNGKTFSLGDNVEISNDDPNIKVDVQLDYLARQGMWELPTQSLQVLIKSNKGILKECLFESGNKEASVYINVRDVIWLRAELYGVLNNIRTMIAFTNPIYFHQ
ncbi:CehA/McbA family metallohydrolase [Sporosarcina sp. Marseille-Q4063]|uniref:CehA/McbA family metallohydrolase n=1 Tax=Sporosarcina sp. Marseille-Q4063 TaxID=2810514 RepID=UPI001BAF2477|nr:CehA/McbA family metallohydrolase [Sporosarcina sp. Marseille-Q4063]QUW21514.1 CehA/McbA family metallohydrolase [Sporosarcina sp. Marseille-Q4063]